MVIFAVIVFVLWWRGYLARWMSGISGAFTTPRPADPFSWDTTKKG